jgi:hypothetical protein
MKRQILGIISLISSIVYILFGIFEILFTNELDNSSGAITWIGIFILLPSILTIIYVLGTKFGKKEISELEKIRTENQILKLQLEQKELISKLK